MPLRNRGIQRQFECSCLDHYQSYAEPREVDRHKTDFEESRDGMDRQNVQHVHKTGSRHSIPSTY